MTKSRLQNNVQQVVDQIVGLVNPLKVILFGSAVNGRIDVDSDLDFLVVISETQQPDEVVDRLNINIRKKPMPCDFLVVTAANLKRHQNRPGLIYSEILKHGKEIYAA